MGSWGAAMGIVVGVLAAIFGVRASRSFAAILLIVGLAALLAPSAVTAQEWSAPRTVFVPTTGHTSDGLFLDAWRSDRSLLGDPATEEFQPKSGFSAVNDADVVQYYEHLALVYLPKEAPGEQVKALDLGRQALKSATEAGRSLALARALERTVCSPASGISCTNIVASGHTLRGPFRTYWQDEDVNGWLGVPLTEAFTAPDGTRVQYFENGMLRETASGTAEPLPLGRISARQAQIATEPIEQPTDVPVYDEELFNPPPEVVATPVDETEGTVSTDWSFGPGPQQGGWKEVVVSISAQMMWAYEGGELVNSSLVSTGTGEVPETTTPIEYSSILAKFDVQTMEGTISGQYYRVEDVPNVMYFDNLGDALHGTYWHSNFGTPMSHGCVNLPLDVASWMYAWAPVGTAVSVIP